MIEIEFNSKHKKYFLQTIKAFEKNPTFTSDKDWILLSSYSGISLYVSTVVTNQNNEHWYRLSQLDEHFYYGYTKDIIKEWESLIC